jgi:membrane fusion protein
VREDSYLARKQQLSQLNQTLALRRSSILETQGAAQQAGAQAKTQMAALSTQRSDIAQRRTSTRINQAYQLTAPISGRATAISLRKGQFAGGQNPAMIIVPENAELQAELLVPTTAIGFLRKDQAVKLTVDAFPSQKFGVLNARLLDIAQAPITKTDAAGAAVPVYLVTAEIEAQSILAFGKNQPLFAGMTLSAQIETEKQTMIEWLFEPLFAVRKRS